jgi:uncharacterized membrane protein YfcA
VPAAFAGVLVLESMGSGQELQDRISKILGIALIVAAAAIVAKALVQRGRAASNDGVHGIRVRPVITIGIGVLGGLVVGMTSVGSGSLMIVLLLMLYPTLRANQLVGTDLVQAVPLVLAAAIGHLIWGAFELSLTTSLLVGSIPGVIIGAHLSSRAPDAIIRPILAVVLTLSGMKLLGASNELLGATLAVAVVGALVAGAVWFRTRRVEASLRTPHEHAPGPAPTTSP